jgi:5'-methylthioadenosine phosphorylase
VGDASSVFSLSPCAAGLAGARAPGRTVVVDQLVDRTWGRPDTFFDGPEVHHVSFADPYDAAMRSALVDAARRLGLPVHDGGTMVVVQGPRFSTRAESRWFTSMGCEVINMTGHPEAVLAAELAIPYAAVALITDYDVGLEGVAGVEPVTKRWCSRSSRATSRVQGAFSKRSPRCRNLLAPSPRSHLI